MEQTYINHWIDFENKALDTVKQSEDNLIVKYCVMPPFEDATCFQLFEDEEGNCQYKVKCWRRNQDHQVFEDSDEYIKQLKDKFKPTIDIKQGTVDPTEYQTILTRLKSLQLPTFANTGGDMLEGVYYEMTLPGEKMMIYEWWNTLPNEWTRLNEVIEFLEGFKN